MVYSLSRREDAAAGLVEAVEVGLLLEIFEWATNLLYLVDAFFFFLLVSICGFVQTGDKAEIEKYSKRTVKVVLVLTHNIFFLGKLL